MGLRGSGRKNDDVVGRMVAHSLDQNGEPDSQGEEGGGEGGDLGHRCKPTLENADSVSWVETKLTRSCWSP